MRVLTKSNNDYVILNIKNPTYEMYEIGLRRCGLNITCVKEEHLTEDLCVIAILSHYGAMDHIPMKYKSRRCWLNYLYSGSYGYELKDRFAYMPIEYQSQQFYINLFTALYKRYVKKGVSNGTDLSGVKQKIEWIPEIYQENVMIMIKEIDEEAEKNLPGE